MPAPRQQKYCTMNCGPHNDDKRNRAQRMAECDTCAIETVYGDPIDARDAEIADLRAALSQRAPISDAEIHELWQQSYSDTRKVIGFGVGSHDRTRLKHPVAFARALLAAQGDMSAQSTDNGDASKNDAGIDISAQGDHIGDATEMVECDAMDHAEDKLAMVDASLEIRMGGDGALDEVIGHGPYHLEQMDDGHWWMRFEDISGAYADVNLTARGKIKATVEQSVMPMFDRAPDARKMIDTIRTLTKYNEWRRAGGDLPDPKIIGDAIDAAIAALSALPETPTCAISQTAPAQGVDAAFDAWYDMQRHQLSNEQVCRLIWTRGWNAAIAIAKKSQP
ncbi:MAG TPA: hypothetical protein DIT28_09995 [Oxalobacteraceae bacterium]|nr:hypothetical protein [Oxalobacteraceae bacterium]